MESAAKRKAASAAVGDSDGRPAKRQKVPVRAACIGGRGIGGGGLEMVDEGRVRCGMAPGRAARDTWGSTSRPSPPPAPPCRPQHQKYRRDAYRGRRRGLQR